MSELKDQIVRLIEQDARARVAAMARSYPHARPEAREEIMAGIEFEHKRRPSSLINRLD